MHLDITLSQACYLRYIIEERVETLKRKHDKYVRFSHSSEDIVAYQTKLAVIFGEIQEMELLKVGINTVISRSMVAQKLLDEFDITTH